MINEYLNMNVVITYDKSFFKRSTFQDIGKEVFAS